MIWSPNYAPELIGIPPLVTDAAEWLLSRGHDVEVVTAFPNYPERRIHAGYANRLWTIERRNGVVVRRSWLRVRPRERVIDKTLHEATFTLMSAPRLVRRLAWADVVVCVVPALTAGWTAGLLARMAGRLGRRSRSVLWIQDIVLDAAASVGGTSALARRAISAAGALEASAYRAADRIVVCSPAFVDHVTRHGIALDRVRIVLNWVDPDDFTPLPAPPPGPTRFLYAGNIGYTQGFETLLEAAKFVGDAVEVVIVGEGNAATNLRRRAATIGNVDVRPPVARSEYPSLLASAHAHVVLQRRVSADTNLPSKIGPYLASGRPIVASIAPWSAAATLLRESGGALLVEPEQPEQLAGAMRRLCAEPALRDVLAANGRRFAVARLGRQAMLESFEAALLA